MKISGKEIAKAKMKQKESLANEGREIVDQQEAQTAGMGHIDCMGRLIEAIHSKDPKSAHQHMMDYAKMSMESDKDKM